MEISSLILLARGAPWSFKNRYPLVVIADSQSNGRLIIKLPRKIIDSVHSPYISCQEDHDGHLFTDCVIHLSYHLIYC